MVSNEDKIVSGRVVYRSMYMETDVPFTSWGLTRSSQDAVGRAVRDSSFLIGRLYMPAEVDCTMVGSHCSWNMHGVSCIENSSDAGSPAITIPVYTAPNWCAPVMLTKYSSPTLRLESQPVRSRHCTSDMLVGLLVLSKISGYCCPNVCFMLSMSAGARLPCISGCPRLPLKFICGAGCDQSNDIACW